MAKLTYKFLKGQEDRYKVSTISSETIMDDSTEESRKDNSVNMELVQKIIDLDNDGTGHIVMIVDKGPPAHDGGKQTYFIKMATNGKILVNSSGHMQNTPSLPDKDVMPGHSWTGESIVNLPGVKSSKPYKNIYKLEKFEDIDEYNCAVISMKSETLDVNIDIPDYPDFKVRQIINSDGKIFFAPEEGKLIKSVTNTYTTSYLPDNKLMETEMTVKVEIM
ncbi:MAG: hypothetical protein ABRQ38_01915 [Candidatus Eremiobacterota bacterium]